MKERYYIIDNGHNKWIICTAEDLPQRIIKKPGKILQGKFFGWAIEILKGINIIQQEYFLPYRKTYFPLELNDKITETTKKEWNKYNLIMVI